MYTPGTKAESGAPSTDPSPPDLTDALVRSSLDGIFALDRDVRYTLWNPAMERFTGLPRARVIGQRAVDLFPKVETTGAIKLLHEALAGREVVDEGRHFDHPSGKRVFFEGHYSPLRDGDGRVIGALGIVRDITDRRRAEEALVEREELFRSVVENASDAIAILDASGLAKYVSPSLEHTLGYGRSEMLGKNALEPVHAEDRDRMAEALTRVVAHVGTHAAFEARWRHKDGGYRTLDGHLRSFRDRDGLLRVSLTARDVSDAKRAQAELLRRTAELDTVFLALHDRCLRLDEEGRIVSLLAGRADEMIVPPKDAEGKRPKDLLAPDAAVAVDRAFRQMQETRQPAIVEYAAQTAKGLQHFEARLVPFQERESISVIRNITDRRRAEEALRTSEERLRASQKMEAIGRLAGGVAHDFNNLLTVILGCTSLLARSFAEPNPYLEELGRAADRAVALASQLLALSRRQVVQPKVLDLNAIVADMQTMLRRLIGEHIDLTTSLDARLGKVKADPGQIEQVILNLVLNARDALEQGGHIALTTREVELDEATARARDGAEPGPYVVLAVEDDGTGMDAHVMAHLFEPFFTTKARGKGTGLGLATVYGIVKQSGGHIVVESTPGKGTRMTIHLPHTTGKLDAVPLPPSDALVRGTETILLVEDEEALRRLVATILGECGYTVIEARSAEDALRICDERKGKGEPLDLVLTDVVMPGMSGRLLAARVLERWPQANVLLMSGYDDAGPQGDEIALLAKPFTAATLAQRVRDVIDAHRAA
jgi:two-component system cell cycle sensor histidine kinase/response regulator CckA